MEELSSVDHEERIDFYKIPEPEPEIWQRIGDAAFTIFSLFALGAFFPALVKKKRVYTIGVPDQPVQQIAVVEEPTQPPSVQPIIPRKVEPQKNVVKEPVPLCTDTEASHVRNIFNTLSEGVIWPWQKGIFLGNPKVIYNLKYTWGAAIEHIHPFSFLLAAPKRPARRIFTEDVEITDGVRNDGQKAGGVMEGICRGMERHYVKNNLLRYLSSFEEQFTTDWEFLISPNVKLPIDHEKYKSSIENLIRARDWRTLADYLFLTIPMELEQLVQKVGLQAEQKSQATQS